MLRLSMQKVDSNASVMNVDPTLGTVLLLKAPKQDCRDDPFIKVLQAAGYRTSCVPVLSFIFCHMEELQAAICSPHTHSGVIFTSQRAVEAVVQCLKEKDKLKEWEQRLSTVWKEKYCFVVGKATGKSARELGFLPIGEEIGNADGLVSEILKMIPTSSLPLLFPCGNLRRETIPEALSKAGVSLEGVTCYQTGPDPTIRHSLEGFLEKKGVPEYVVFFSPSGVEFTKPHLEDLQLTGHTGTTKWVAIGSTTRQALEKAGLAVTAEALSPTPEGLLEALNQVRMARSS